jgi:hypothetical protein
MTASDKPSTTPILDLLEPLPRPRVEKVILRGVVLFLVLVAFAIFFWNSEILLIVTGYLLLTFALIAIHELGHILAGWSVGLRLQSIGIGPLQIEREVDNWRLGLRPHLVTGFTSMSFDRILRMRQRLIVFLVGGPIASFLTSVIAFSILPMIEQKSSLLPIVGWAGVLSFLIVIINLHPKRFGRDVSDGLKLKILLKSREGTKQLIAIHALAMLKNRNLDPAQCNRRWIRVAFSGPLVQNTWFADMQAYKESVDSSPTSAAEYLERCLARSALLDSKARDELILEATVFTAWYRDDTAKADEWYKRAVTAEHAGPLARVRVEVALHCIHRRFDEALTKCQEGILLIQKLPQSKAALCEPSWIEWRKEIEQRRHQATLTKKAAST